MDVRFGSKADIRSAKEDVGFLGATAEHKSPSGLTDTFHRRRFTNLAALVQLALNHQAEWMKYSIAEAFVLERQSMREELGALKCEVEILRSIVKAGNVEQLVRKSNAG